MIINAEIRKRSNSFHDFLSIYKLVKFYLFQECADEAEDFHSVQCATYNKQPFQGWYLQWKPQKKVHDCKFI